MVHFTEIRPTRHYLEAHADEVPWAEVVGIILTEKKPRKRVDRFEIQSDGVYVLFEIEGGVLWVINAKRGGGRGP